MNVQTRREVRLGLIALALAGLLWTVALPLRGPADLADPGSCCRTGFSTTFQGAWILIVVGAMLLIYGFIGLYRYLSYRAENLIALLALVISLIAGALFFSLATFFAVSGPAIADLVRSGDHGAIAVVEANFRSPLGVSVLTLRSVAWIIGPLLFAVAIWRDGRLPRWTGPVFALSFLLLIPLTFPTEFLGVVLFFASAGTMAWKGWQHSAARTGKEQ